MAFPVILVNSATGSDTAASGAGPSTALTGSSASTDVTGLIVTLDGSPSLTNVATDGTHCIFLNDSTAGARNFGRITAKDDGAKTVTVDTAFRTGASGLSWAIGGKRATISGTTSIKLFSNNAAAGDAMPGWTVRMESGHTESGTGINARRAGNTTDGWITLEGEDGAVTRPVYTCSAGALTTIQSHPMYVRFRNFDLKKSGSSGSTAISGVAYCEIVGMRILNNGGVKFATGIQNAVNNGGLIIRDCYIETVTGDGIYLLNCGGAIVENNVINGCGSSGVFASLNSITTGFVFRGNIVSGCVDGIKYTNASTSATVQLPTIIANNTIDSNTGDGIEVGATSTQIGGLQNLIIENNQITDNGGYGVNFSGTSVTDFLLSVLRASVRNNNFGTGATSNTSGDINLTLTLTGSNNIAVDPQYAGSGVYTVGTNSKALGFPLTDIGGGIVAGNRSYVDIGALQRKESGGGGLVLPRGMNGGFGD